MEDPKASEPAMFRTDPKERALAAAVADIQKKTTRFESSPPVETNRIRPVFFVLLLLGLIVVLFVNATDSSHPDPVPAETSLRETLYVTVLALDAELEETGVLPADLETIGMDEEGLSYEINGGGYTLVATDGAIRVEFNSGDDLAPLRAAFESLLPPHEAVR